jgi:hypothetical protein
MIFMVMFVLHDRFTAATTNSVPFKRTALLVCTTNESTQRVGRVDFDVGMWMIHPLMPRITRWKSLVCFCDNLLVQSGQSMR